MDESPLLRLGCAWCATFLDHPSVPLLTYSLGRVPPPNIPSHDSVVDRVPLGRSSPSVSRGCTQLGAWRGYNGLEASCAPRLLPTWPQTFSSPASSGHSLGFLEDKPQGARAYQASAGARLAIVPLAHAGHLTKPAWMRPGSKQGLENQEACFVGATDVLIHGSLIFLSFLGGHPNTS